MATPTPHDPGEAADATAEPERPTGRSAAARWAREQQAAKEAAMSPTERIELALRLGLRAKALAAAVRR